MTPQRAKELLPVIRAFSEDKAVQYKSKIDGSWIEASTATFDAGFEWRVKPEPREYWIVKFPSNAEGHRYYTTNFEPDARGYQVHLRDSGIATSEIIHVREVL